MMVMRFPVPILALCALAAALPASASLLDYVGECVPFARAVSGIQIHGDAWTWWQQAEGRYARGATPATGSVIVFAKTARLPRGHVAVVSRVIDRRVVMVTHANWSRQNGARGHVEQDVTLTDVSADNDWSAVKVWYQDTAGLGATTYPIYGFVHGRPVTAASAPVRPSPELTSPHPDYVGALIDAYR